jgi:serine protease SohB
LQFLTEYGLFLAKTLTLVVALLFVVMMLLTNAGRHKSEGKPKGHLNVVKLNDELEDLKEDLRHEILDEELLKLEAKEEKKKDKAEKKAKLKALKARSKAAALVAAEAEAEESGETSGSVLDTNTAAATTVDPIAVGPSGVDQPTATGTVSAGPAVESLDPDDRKRIFVMSFDGDTAASEVDDLRQVITAVLQVARSGVDEVMLRLESPGGMVHAYGLAASQLARLRKHNIRLTICVDKVAASGGYMMACIANHLIAAPFAYIGSIGVLVQLPNVHRLLKDHKVDFEMITAGEYKRTLTTFGENTDADRAKVQEEVDEMHTLFKDFIHTHRPALDLALVATGEVWSGSQALTKGLVDALDTSDEWLVAHCKDADVYEVSWELKRRFADRLSSMLEGSLRLAITKTLTQWLHRADKEKFFS